LFRERHSALALGMRTLMLSSRCNLPYSSIFKNIRNSRFEPRLRWTLTALAIDKLYIGSAHNHGHGSARGGPHCHWCRVTIIGPAPLCNRQHAFGGCPLFSRFCSQVSRHAVRADLPMPDMSIAGILSTFSEPRVGRARAAQQLCVAALQAMSEVLTDRYTAILADLRLIRSNEPPTRYLHNPTEYEARRLYTLQSKWAWWVHCLICQLPYDLHADKLRDGRLGVKAARLLSLPTLKIDCLTHDQCDSFSRVWCSNNYLASVAARSLTVHVGGRARAGEG